jgi:hypothetical protein
MVVIANSVLKAWSLTLFVSLSLSTSAMDLDVSELLGSSDESYSSEVLEDIPSFTQHRLSQSCMLLILSLIR